MNLKVRWYLHFKMGGVVGYGYCAGLLAGVIMLCSWETHFTFIVPLSLQVYKWVPPNLLLGITCDGQASHPGSSNTPIRFMLWQPGKAMA